MLSSSDLILLHSGKPSLESKKSSAVMARSNMNLKSSRQSDEEFRSLVKLHDKMIWGMLLIMPSRIVLVRVMF